MSGVTFDGKVMAMLCSNEAFLHGPRALFPSVLQTRTDRKVLLCRLERHIRAGDAKCLAMIFAYAELLRCSINEACPGV
jgi:hypothetical protein